MLLIRAVYYLNNAVYLVNGDHTRPNAISRRCHHRMFAPRIVQRILASAPSGGDVTSWRY